MNPLQPPVASTATAHVADAAPPAAGGRRAGAAQGIALMAILAMPTLALAALVPSLPQLFQQFSSVPNFQLLVPMIITVPSLCVALFSGVMGAIADRWGRRKLLLAALFAFALLGHAPLMFDSLLLIVASRVVVGLAEAAILTVGNALMGDYFEGEQRQKWLGYQNMFAPLIGSAILLSGGFLAGLHWRYPFLLYLSGFAVLALVWLVCWEPGRHVQAHAGQPVAAAPFPWRVALLVGGVTVLFSLVFFVQAVQHGRIFGDMGVASPERISVLATIASLGTVVGGYLFKRYGKTTVARWMAVILAFYGASYLGVAWAPSLAIGLPLDALGQVGGGLMLPVLVTWALQKYSFEHRGRGMGLWGGAFFLGQFLSPPLVTLIGSAGFSFLGSVAVIGGVCIVAAIVMTLTQKEQ
ncbi:Predicted arabinose efflux permease, MFS family [Duganella sp. CF402]|uniref:MFS transporter n=1 Tax=unclassified Duganella TaxID=2636909 RepID=UPI0008CC3BEA|nr:MULTISPECIES: MFS transporter [unclassified Duganella]RZT10261.1 putative MFS family arabinose efflux permease [Duganella sp. BK701]SEL21430.1 Predicted arabinose efflux permease, MFS family [Duganella sp. CF402]